MVVGGAKQKAHYLAMDLPHSDACYVKAYPAETTEAFCDGHVSVFAFLGGGDPRAFCTTTPRWRWPGYWETAAVSVVSSELQSHYLFDDRFGRPDKGNDKEFWINAKKPASISRVIFQRDAGQFSTATASREWWFYCWVGADEWINTGGRLVCHARRQVFQLAEVLCAT